MTKQGMVAFLAMGLVACGSSTGGGGGGSGGGGAGGAPGRGSATISGSIGSKAWSSATTSYLIGAADPGPNNLRATVIYVFEKDIACASISKVGWDVPAILGSTQTLEMRAIGPVPGTFEVVGPPPAGNTAGAAG